MGIYFLTQKIFGVIVLGPCMNTHKKPTITFAAFDRSLTYERQSQYHKQYFARHQFR